MATKNASSREGEGAVVDFEADTSVIITAAVRAQVLNRHYIPRSQQGLIAAHHYGEPRE